MFVSSALSSLSVDRLTVDRGYYWRSGEMPDRDPAKHTETGLS
jgi:hypothetical protein